MTNHIFEPIEIGGKRLANRIAMAPMTRSRAGQPGNVPNALMAIYYGQRASAGLIISEGTAISPAGRGYSMTPGIYSTEQIDGWRIVTEAVHQKNGAIFLQLWHVGRRGHSAISELQPLCPSAVKDPDTVFGPMPDGGYGRLETEAPRAMTIEDIKRTIDEYVQAAKNAIAAGFDGVEVHAAHGYLPEQFLRVSTNKRTDSYGGSQDNRMRFLVEVLTQVAAEIGPERVGVRLSPFLTEGYAVPDPDIAELTLKLLKRISPLGLAYVHFSENISRFEPVPESFRTEARRVFSNPIMVAGGLSPKRASALIQDGYADMVAFGAWFISNPDLVARLKHGWPIRQLSEEERASLYGGGAAGYTDYPVYAADA